LPAPPKMKSSRAVPRKLSLLGVPTIAIVNISLFCLKSV
jgi:hypothetical protein